MGSYVSREDEELKTSMSRNRNTAKNFYYFSVLLLHFNFIYGLMNVGR